MKYLFVIILSLFFILPAKADGTLYADSSALHSGTWVKVKITETGIYKITADELKKMGFSDINKVSVHGYGGWPLSEDFTTTYIDDVPACAIYKGTDYILFYGHGPIKWEYNSTNGFVHTNNPYSTSGYYFITDATNVSEMKKIASSESSALQINTFDDHILHEQDLVSVNASGRELYGESFETTLSRDFSVSIPGITSDAGRATLSFIAKATTGSSTVTMNIDDNQVISAVVYKSPTSDSYTKALSTFRSTTWNGTKNESTKVNIQYGTTGHQNVYLDYFCLQMKRTLKVYGGCTLFRSIASKNNASHFVISGADANTLVFDVTDAVNPTLMETTLSGTELSFNIPASSTLREFALVQPSGLSAPTTVGTVTNQNLHGLPQTDMIIIAQPALVAQAERLAAAHRTKDSISVQVVTPESIYNEFSSGTPDATAYRRFMKMFYDRSKSSSDAPKYLLLFGDGAFDNRQLTTTWKSIDMSNMLLTYQTENSLDASSYVVDDYFGFLSDSESAKSIEYRKVDIGIGRFPVRTVSEAAQTVDKVITYMNNGETGSWKNNVCFVADDGSSADSYSTEHEEFADLLATYMEADHSEFLVNKIFFDSYKKDFTGGTTTYPDVNSEIKKELKNGLLLINYTGHGNTTSWGDEKVVKQTDIGQYTYTRLPIWITATCDFTRFDDNTTSAGEDVFLNATSGGIALFTTTRVAYSSPNFSINDNLIRGLFEKENGRRLTLGEVMKNTKCKLVSTSAALYKLGFSLIGDPAMKLAYPEYPIEVTSINGAAVTDTVQFKALQKITVKGEVHNADGNLATNFTGSLSVTVKDSKVTETTLDNNSTGTTFSYTDYPNTLYIGNDSVRNGQFSFTFTVPKDISYSNLAGKMNLYASDAVNGNEAQGSFQKFIVGGTGSVADADTIGPEIRSMYLNDTTFVSGGNVNATPYFVAKLWDQSGINITGSSVGHDMMLIIDGSSDLAYNLNSYYSLLSNEDGAGIVQFQIPALSSGTHTAQFRVWDILNNSTDTTFTFNVVEGLKPFILDITATPSPAHQSVTFSIFHNRPESKMTVGIMVYDMMGRLQWRHTETGSSELFKAYTITWDLTSGSGARLIPGVYIYRAAISTNSSKEATKARKLIILGY